MTIQEFSDSFDVLINAYANVPEAGKSYESANLAFNEYEKSVFLTKAQEEIVLSLYTGKNAFQESFESNEELRRELDSLVVEKSYSTPSKLPVNFNGASDNSVVYKLESDLLFIIFEQVIYKKEGDCHSGSRLAVYPATHDEYNVLKDNPFRGPSKYKVVRLDCGNNYVELIPEEKDTIDKYIVRYLKKPDPILLVYTKGEGVSIDGVTSAQTCKLHPALHQTILNRAVALAVASRVSNAKN